MSGLVINLQVDEPIFIDGIKLTLQRRVNSGGTTQCRIRIEDPKKRPVYRSYAEYYKNLHSKLESE